MQGPIAARACVAVCALAMAAGGRADNANANPAIKLDNGNYVPWQDIAPLVTPGEGAEPRGRGVTGGPARPPPRAWPRGIAARRLTHGAAASPPWVPRPGVMMPTLALGTGGFDNATAADAITKAFSEGESLRGTAARASPAVTWTAPVAQRGCA